MNKRKAISECKKVWKEIKESRLSKEDFLETPAGRKWIDKGYANNCPLCEYASDSCSKCPLVTQYGKDCYELGFEHNEVYADSIVKYNFTEKSPFNFSIINSFTYLFFCSAFFVFLLTLLNNLFKFCTEAIIIEFF